MTTERRLILFFVLSLALYIAINLLLTRLGLIAPPREPRAPEEVVERAGDDAAPPRAFAGEPDGPPAFAEVAPVPALAAVDPADAAALAPDAQAVPDGGLVIGAANPAAEPVASFHMLLALDQKGAAIRSIDLAYHEAERAERFRPGQLLTVMDADPERAPVAGGPPGGLDLIVPGDGDREDLIVPLSSNVWEVVRDEQNQLVRHVFADPSTSALEGQEVVFRTSVPSLDVTVTKTIRLRKGSDAAEVAIEIAATTPRELAYRLHGPYGVPIEGEWYTSTFREVFFGKIDGGSTSLDTRPANEVQDSELRGDPIRTTTLPIKFAGIENQYFAVFLQPEPLPERPEDRWDARTVAGVVTPAPDKNKSDISVTIESKPFRIGPGEPLAHTYRIFAGPKTSEALTSYGAELLATYRKGWQIWIIGPIATFLARTVIAPLLDQIYGLTLGVARVFSLPRGSYGISIIFLTILVRLMMFPLSRRQAQSARRMQELQPQLLALREKYKDDKEKIGRETLAIYKQNGVNPFGGCLIALIQMPIFLGLWQALNNSVSLRNAPFLWINSLAAPDQLFRFPFDIPFLGVYFNVLPFIVVALMMVQTKLFSPPATTPEQEQSQKIMKFMLIVMAVMFYRVPSGLGLYFITSSLWSIAERLLLPSTRLAPLPPPSAEPPPASPGPKSPAPRSPAPPSDSNGKPGGWRDRLRERLDQVIQEAEHQRTVRNAPSSPAPQRERKSRPKGPRR
jgi:YidC/Oxa1 family membrane protein insertase